jgi:hypothetical protein
MSKSRQGIKIPVDLHLRAPSLWEPQSRKTSLLRKSTSGLGRYNQTVQKRQLANYDTELRCITKNTPRQPRRLADISSIQKNPWLEPNRRQCVSILAADRRRARFRNVLCVLLETDLIISKVVFGYNEQVTGITTNLKWKWQLYNW